MKLNTTKSKTKQPVDLTDLYLSFDEKYDHVFMEELGESGVFIFRSLGRKEYREIVESTNITDCEKEEIICETCVLFPDKIDFSDCEEAGLPTVLSKLILERSMLASPDALQKMIHHFRSSLQTDLNSQISCVIHEAFPEYEISDIDAWDIVKTAEYMSRSEFILHSLRGVPMAPVDTAEQGSAPYDDGQPYVDPERSIEENFTPVNAPAKKTILTPQKMAELQRLAPNVDWSKDLGVRGPDSLLHNDVDTRRPTEIPIDGSESGDEAIPLALRDRFKAIKENN